MARRAKKTYGNTPWGARLKAQLVSLGGRIDRGEALARTGKVFDTALRNGRVRTRVKGSSAPFYDVSLTFAPVPEEKRATVAHVVAGDLLLTAELVSGNLPVSLLDALEDAGVRILPRSFQELNGQCNCPDNMGGSGGFYGASVKRAGDPCKHQAACMFEVIGELDKNPRTLLVLRGIDVDSLVGTGGGDAGAAASDAGELPYPLPTTAFCAGGGEARVVRGKLTFPHFQSNAKTIAQVLAPSPMFSKDDFSAVLAAFYASVTEKKIASALGAEEAWEKKLNIDAVRPLLERAKYTLSVPESLSVRNVRVIVESDMWSLSDGDAGSEARLVEGAAASDNAGSAGERDPSSAAKTPKETLGTLPFEAATPSEADGVSPRVRISLDTFRRLIMALPSDGSVGSESYLFFFHAVRASLLMFSSTNMVPDIVPGSVAGSWNVFYRPFVSNSAVAECMTRLESVYPQLEGCVRLRAKGDADGAVLLGESAGTLHAVCVLLTHLVCAFNYNGKKVASPERGSFFDNQPYSAVNFSDKSNGLVAKRWLSVFRLLSLEAQVLLKLDEVVPGDEQAPYSVELFFRDSEEKPAMASGGMDDTTDESTAASPRKATKVRQVAALVDPAASGWETPRKYMSMGSRQSQDALKFVVALRDYIPAVEALLQDGRAEIEADLFEQFILERSGVLRSLGTSLLLPKGIKEVLQPRLVTELSMMSDDADKATWKKSYLKFAELLSFNYRVMLGDECVDLEVFHEMVAKGRRLFQFKGKFVELDPQNIANILAARNRAPPKPADAMELLRDVISGDLKYSLSEMVSELMADIQRVEKPAVPGDLKAELRPYQVNGYQWALSNLRSVGAAALCDDMGLGKTIQTIAVILALKEADYLEESPALVVCPTSLLSNWRRELTKFAPSLWVLTCSGPNRALTFKAAVGEKRKKTSGPDVILMSYGTVRQDVATLNKACYALLIIDEAQAIKNHKSAVSKAVKKIGAQASFRLALTGTVVENRLAELHSCFDFCLPGYLGTLKEFTNRFAKPIENERDQETLELLKRMTSCFMLRREKTDPAVISDLPAKIESKLYVQLSQEQVALYESVRASVFEVMAQEKDAPAGSVMRRSVLVLKLLSDLKQICNHPACYGDRPGDVSPERSQKCLDLLELLGPIVESGEKVLVFSQYVKTIRILEKQIASKFGIRPLVFEGSLSQDQRDAIIHQFDRNPARQVLLLSLKAGGVGLNLTSANHVVLFDRWWNDSAEQQAIDRAFRIGQKKNVFVHKIICADTFEEKIDDMVEKKKEIASLTASSGEQWVGKMSDDELKDLFALSSAAEK